jgi:hypothetical protein
MNAPKSTDSVSEIYLNKVTKTWRQCETWSCKLRDKYEAFGMWDSANYCTRQEKISVFWDAAAYGLVKTDQRFSGTRLDDGGCKQLWNVGLFLPDYMTEHSRRHSSSYSSLQ